MRNSVLEISRKNFEYNISEIRKYINNSAELMSVVKANGYGTYLNKDLDLMNHFKILAVAIVDEAVELRRLGYKKDIFVLNQPFDDEIGLIEENNIIVGCSSFEFLDEIKKLNRRIRIHIELETGMGRTGVQEKDLDRFIDEVKAMENVSVEGIYTHFAVADNDEEFTKKQIEIFEAGVLKIKERIDTIKYVHSSASNGLLNYGMGICNLVRPGLIMYGYETSDSTFDKIDLRPVSKLKSKISYLKEIESGTSISYGRTFISDRKMMVATVAIGYADGIRRDLSNVGEVSIHGKRCKIVGRVCMDSFMVDVTELEDVKVNDDVYIWDNEVVTLEDVAEKCNTINYEILATVGERVPRVFID